MKITGLPARAAVALTDIVAIVDAAGGVPATWKATVAQVRAVLMPIVLTVDVLGLLPLANQAAPTGTGVIKGVAGAWGAAAALIVDADVATGAAVAVAKLAPGANTQVLTTAAGVSVWAAAPAGTAVPTGTGVPKIVAGVQSAAAALVVDADVAAGAALAVAKLAPSGTNGFVLTTSAGVSGWAAAGAGAVPTGTGFNHISAGAQDAASKKVDLTAAADVTVPATVGGVVTSSGTALQQASGVLAGTNFVSLGATPSAAGNIRLPTAFIMNSVRNAGGVDLPVLHTDSGDALWLGDTTVTAASVISSSGFVYTRSASFSVQDTAASVDRFLVNSTSIAAAVPIVGGVTSPYGVHGETIVATAPPFSLAAADYAMGTILLSNAGAGIVTFPAVTANNPKAYTKTIINSGASAKALTNGGVTTVNIAGATVGQYLFDVAGVHLISATQAWV